MSIEIRFESIDNYREEKGFIIVSSNNTSKGGAALQALVKKHPVLEKINWHEVPIVIRAYRGSHWWCTPDRSIEETNWLEKYENETPIIDEKFPFFPHIRIKKNSTGTPQSFSHIMRVHMIPQDMWPSKELEKAMRQMFRAIFSCVHAIQSKEQIKFTSIGMTMLGSRQNYTLEMFIRALVKAVNGLNVLCPLKIYCHFSGNPPYDKQYEQLIKTLVRTIQSEHLRGVKPILDIASSACKQKLKGKNDSLEQSSTIKTVKSLLNELVNMEDIMKESSSFYPYQRLASAAREVVLQFLRGQTDDKIQDFLNSPLKPESHSRIKKMILDNKLKEKRGDFQLSCLYHIVLMANECDLAPRATNNELSSQDDWLLVRNTNVLLAMIPIMLETILPDVKGNQ